ncbi:hypothetical protein G9A89_011892 [Geosiphon pyriformis]|nr:hypothetical protein G9A89_011892 [Geosiphon pyriformis]
MSTKKLARDVTTSSVSESLRQKPKVLLGKIKHSGDEADLTYKLPTKDMSYDAGSESDGQLDSCTNTPKAKCFDSGTVNALSLGLCDFGSAINDFDMGLSPPVSLRPPHCPVVSVKKKLCFEPTKSFALDIGLLAVPRSTLCDKLKGVKSLFYKIDTSFTSDSSFAMAKQLAVSKNFVVNTNLKKIGIHSDRKIVIKEISVDLPKSAIKSVLVKYRKIFSIKKVLVEFKSSQVTDLIASKWSILLNKDLVHRHYHALLYTLPIGMTAHNLSDLVQLYGGKTYYISRNLVSYAQVYCTVICFDFNNAKEAAICSMLVFRGVNLIWAGLSSSKCTACENFGYVSSNCESSEKNSGQSSRKKRFLCFDLNKRCLVLIYAKKQASVSCPAFVVSGSPKNSYSIPFVGNNLSIGLVDSLMPAVTILALCVSVLKHLLENVLDQVINISHKLDRLLAILLVNFAVPSSPEHNPVLDMTVDTLLFVFPVPSVITAISQEISSSGAHVLTAKVGGLEANLAVLENLVKAILNKLNSFTG